MIIDRESNVPFCKDCQHFNRVLTGTVGSKTEIDSQCTRTADVVVGQSISAWNARSMPELCGPEGKWFKPVTKVVTSEPDYQWWLDTSIKSLMAQGAKREDIVVVAGPDITTISINGEVKSQCKLELKPNG